MIIPNEVSEKGLDPDVRRALNQLIRAVRQMIPQDSSTVSVTHNSSGIHLAVKESARGGGNGSTTPRWG